MSQGTIGVAAGAALALLFGAGAALAAGRRRLPAGSEPPWFAYKVAKGDTLSGLALRFFGDAAKWPVIAEVNPQLGLPLADSRSLQVGAELRVPCVWYTVKAGDSLSAIAAAVISPGAGWRRVAAANPQVDPNKLQVGQRLAVPVEPEVKRLSALSALAVGAR